MSVGLKMFLIVQLSSVIVGGERRKIFHGHWFVYILSLVVLYLTSEQTC